MSDEEKKALEILNNTEWDGFMITIKNLIEKQSKEIEELKDTRSIFNMGRRSYKNEIEDKIKAKIEELNNKLKNADEIEAVFIIKQQQVLQSHLKEE